MKAKLATGFSLLLLTNLSAGQSLPSLGDTLKIREVVVKGRPMLRSAGFNRMVVDTLALRESAAWSLSDLLRSSSPMFVKGYGPGGIATVSLRGTGASHTVLTWNGINLNSPMLGQSDFSLVPSILADVVTIHNGGSSIASAQGGLGGVVELETKPSWNAPPFSAETNLSAGGYGRISSASMIRYGEGSWRFTTRFTHGRADNDFEYINRWLTSEELSERRTNASFRNTALLQEVWKRGPRSVTGVRLWIQNTGRQIPVPVNVSPSSHREELSNTLINGLLTHDIYFGSDNSLSLSAISQNDRMIYNDFVTDLLAESDFRRLALNASLYLGNVLQSAMRASISAETASAESDSYGAVKTRNIISFSLSAEHRVAEITDINLNSSANIVDGKLLLPDISAGAEIELLNDDNLVLRANMASKSRVPTLNDLYWYPGGNPLLKPEHALNHEIALRYIHRTDRSVTFSYDIMIFLNNIKDMINWVPGAGGVWAPQNTGKVRAFGTEAGLSLVKSWNNGSINLKSAWVYTRSIDRLTGLMLVHLPGNTALGELRARYKWASAGTSLHYTGIRFSSADNSDKMPAYTVTDLWAGFETEKAGFPVKVNIRLENALNVSYNTMPYHPMPPASVLITISARTPSARLK